MEVTNQDLLQVNREDIIPISSLSPLIYKITILFAGLRPESVY